LKEITIMADELRDRVLAAIRKGLAGPLDTSKTKQPVLQGYRADSAIENGVTSQAARNTTFPNQTKDVTPLHQLSANSDSQPETVCVQCGARDDLWHLDTPTGPAAVHPECFEFLPRPEAAAPTATYQGVTAEPDGTACEVRIVEIPREAGRYKRTFAHLQLKPPEMIDVDRWRQCIQDGRRFLHRWGETARRLNWSAADLFGLIEIPKSPAPNFNRLSRFDRLGLCWLLRGREVVALTEATATIRNPTTGVITTYRRHHKPALGRWAIVSKT
jgi:hypothetical protein